MFKWDFIDGQQQRCDETHFKQVNVIAWADWCELNLGIGQVKNDRGKTTYDRIGEPTHYLTRWDDFIINR